MKLIKVGKVKEIYDDNEYLQFFFTDKISVFDKIIPNNVPNKGESLCRTSTYWFEEVEKSGIPSHFVSLISPSRMRVRKFEVLDSISTSSKNYLIPLEFISRYYLAGSLFDRVQKDKVSAPELGIKKIEYGVQLPEPYFEITTKFEKYDRLLTIEEARKIGGLEKEKIEEIQENILKIDLLINKKVLKNGLVHVDGKKEWALDKERKPVIVDTFGTADEDRFWDLKEYEKGNYIELSKEFVRKYYREIGYYDKLMEARSKDLPEPEITAMPEGLIRQTSELYRVMYEKITGKKW